MTTLFFLITSFICLVSEYFIYFKDKGEYKYLWLLSEFTFGLCIYILMLGTIYLYTNTSHLNDQTLTNNFYTFYTFTTSEGNPVIKNLKNASNIFNLLYEFLFISIGLVLNFFKFKEKVNIN